MSLAWLSNGDFTNGHEISKAEIFFFFNLQLYVCSWGEITTFFAQGILRDVTGNWHLASEWFVGGLGSSAESDKSEISSVYFGRKTNPASEILEYEITL